MAQDDCAASQFIPFEMESVEQSICDRFEQQAEGAGVHRRRWETSSEFTLRVLDRIDADSEAVMVLAELYRDARHSGHDITEDSRRRALEALDVVHRSLDTRARS